MISLEKTNIKSKIKMIKGLKKILKNKGNLDIPFKDKHFSEQVEIVSLYYQIDTNKILEKSPNLSFLVKKKPTIREMAGIVAVYHYIDIIEEISTEYDMKETEIAESLFLTSRFNAEDFRRKDGWLEEDHDIRPYTELFIEEIEEQLIDCPYILLDFLDKLKEKGVINSIAHSSFDEMITTDVEEFAMAKQPLIDLLSESIGLKDDETDDAVEDIVEADAMNFMSGDNHIFYLKIEDDEMFKRVKDIIIEYDMVEFNNIGLEYIGNNEDVFARNNMIQLRFNLHFIDHNSSLGSKLFKAFPLSIFLIYKLIDELENEFLKEE